ncbi:MAG: hypothetical protein COV48_04920 [Elusimicrobia bacterium CG11_big_fil_rev_8_21_14_0_20_64_6]|nr:MAG: hypothetical protein COV48_04920 [Elusimicrobia bacterium CG11_big_fil_rev_8_21_14_0_20_64_6]
MNRREFAGKYPSLSGILASVFQYPEGRSDEEIAREAVEEPFTLAAKRFRLLSELVRESNLALVSLDAEWQVVAKAANRPLQSCEDTREWLLRVTAVWEKLLSEINGTKPS